MTQDAVPSRNPWIKALPRTWREAHMRRFVKLLTGGTPDRSRAEYWNDGTIPWVASGEVNKKRISEVAAKITERGLEESSARWLPPGSVLVALAGQGKTKGTAAILEIWATCNQSLAALIPDESHLHSRFLCYYLESQYSNLRGMVGDEQRDGLSLTHLAGIWVPLPPIELQRAIADFLDRRTAAIDTLVEKKERLIALLAQKRGALIQRAVTRGLNPEVPMNDSGIPWIGHIPAHWEMHQLRRVVSEFVDYRGRTPEKAASGIPLITAGAVRDGKIDHGRVPEWVSEETYEILSRRGGPEVGDLLFTSEAPLGEVGLVVDPRIACAQRIILFRVNKHMISPEYLRLHFLAESGKGEMRSRASGSTAEGIRADRLKMSLVPTPPLSEQNDICAYVEAKTQGFDAISERVQVQLDRLREYRQALITAAVTGQLGIGESSP